MKQKFDVTGMTCSACSAHVEKAVNKLEGVRRAEVSLMTNSMNVEYDEAALAPESIIQAVVQAGYGASLPAQAGVPARGAAKRPEAQMEAELSSMKRRLILSFLFLIPLFYISMGHMMGAPLPAFLVGHENAISFAFTQLLLTLPILYINDKYYKNGFRSLLHGGPNMDSLIAVGSIAAVIYGVFAIYQIGYGLGHGDMARVEQYHMDLYFESAGMILTLITLGKFLETRSKGKTSQAISRLMDLAPKTATVLRDGAEAEIPVEEVRVGDRVAVRPGQSIPVDGVIVEGSSAVDESPLTGESLPVDKGPGDKVAAASINRSGYFVFEASRVGEDTTLAQMIRLVEEASSSKAPISKLADKVAGVFVPTVMVIAAIAAGAWWFATGSATSALTAGVAVLVISCPCALVISTPVTIVSAVSAAARRGVLIKGGVYLEAGRTLKNVCLDKTGTVTKGKPSLSNITLTSTVDKNRAMLLAASLAAMSSHPVSRAIAEHFAEENRSTLPVKDFKALPGSGTQGVIDGSLFFLTNLTWLNSRGSVTPDVTAAFDAAHAKGQTAVALSDMFGVVAVFAVADTLKSNSAQAIALMKKVGLTPWLLTGDNARAAEAIAQKVGIDNVKADLLPEHKLEVIEELESKAPTAMVGDGINDAPALSRARIGFAMGIKGADTAIEAADVAIMDDNIAKIAWFKKLSELTHSTLIQNIVFALGVKFCFMIAALAGYATMWMAVFADTGVCLIVVAWGLRLMRSAGKVDRMLSA